jgi:hypothetical protein
MIEMTQEDKKLVLAALSAYTASVYADMEMCNNPQSVGECKAVLAKIDSLQIRLQRPIKSSSERGI